MSLLIINIIKLRLVEIVSVKIIKIIFSRFSKVSFSAQSDLYRLFISYNVLRYTLFLSSEICQIFRFIGLDRSMPILKLIIKMKPVEQDTIPSLYTFLKTNYIYRKRMEKWRKKVIIEIQCWQLTQ